MSNSQTMENLMLNIPSIIGCYDWIDKRRGNKKEDDVYINAIQLYLLELANIVKSAQIGGS